MKKINRLTILMGLLFAVSACGGNTDIEEEEEEEGENSGYVGNKDKNNDTPNPNPQPDQPQENPIFQTDSGKAFKKLLGESLKESKQKLNEGLDYYMNEIDIVIAEWKAVKRHISNNEYDKAKRVLEDLVDSGMLAEDILSKI